jgi:hypothetical protein
MCRFPVDPHRQTIANRSRSYCGYQPESLYHARRAARMKFGKSKEAPASADNASDRRCCDCDAVRHLMYFCQLEADAGCK